MVARAVAARAIRSPAARVPSISAANTSSSRATAPITGLRDLCFQLTQLRGRETHGVGHGLAMDEDVTIKLVGMHLRRLDVVTQHVVVAHLQGRHTGGLLIARLQGCDMAAAVIAQGSCLIECFDMACAHETTITGQQRWLVIECGIKMAHDFGGGPEDG